MGVIRYDPDQQWQQASQTTALGSQPSPPVLDQTLEPAPPSQPNPLAQPSPPAQPRPAAFAQPGPPPAAHSVPPLAAQPGPPPSAPPVPPAASQPGHPSGPPPPRPEAGGAAPWARDNTRGWRMAVTRETWSGVHRPANQRVLGGVAAALADTIGVSALAARWALVALSFFGGAGMAIYVAGWLFLPAEGSEEPIARAALADRRTVSLVLATASLLLVLLVTVAVLGSTPLLGAVSPGILSLACVVAIWRHAGPDDRVAAQRLAALLSGAGPSTAPTWRRLLTAVVRLLVGAALIAGGTSTLLQPKHLNSTDLIVALAALAVIAGFALVLAPWWLRLGRDLAGERRQRARAEERAEMAEHLHDSVLQTLALIQRSAGDPQQVQRLARAQERQLRSWLFDGDVGSPMGLEEPDSLSEALLALQQEVESVHGIRVEVVTVGDAPLDERSRALVAAAREAVVNAAKWSDADLVSIFAEVEPEAVSVFVRDRGKGFDPAAVARDRRGISESIHARTTRNGGSATVRSSPGEGTEVALKLPRRPQP
jgi:signal transduction histidine kinase